MAKRLEVSMGSIAMWIAKFRASGELEENAKVKAESEELTKLRKENRRLRLALLTNSTRLGMPEFEWS